MLCIGVVYYYLGNVGDREASVNLSQVKVIDTRRLVRKVVTIDKEHFVSVKERLQTI